MQPVNDDMDNLFRRAAEGYPLKSDGADFDKVRQLLDAENNLPSKKSNRKNYLWLLLLLLIPLAFLLGRYYTVDSDKAAQTKTNTYAKQEVATTNPPNTIVNKPIVENKSKAIISIDKEPRTQQPEKVDVSKQMEDDQSPNSDNSIATKQQIVTIKKVSKRNQSNNSVAALNKQPSLENNSVEVVLQSAKNKEKIKPGSFSGAEEELSKTKKNTGTTDIVKSKQETNSADSLHQTTPVNTISDTSNTFVKKVIDTVNQIAAKKAPEKNKINKKPSVYIGVIAGPDASTVKSNKSSGTGYNIGFIAGYYTGKHLAFETGISWNYKKYYSDGKHVSVEKLGLAQHTSIIYLEGNCGMIELPVNIKYHFNTKGNHNWYTGAGISSYIMKKENYDYLSSRYNVQYYGNKEYRNTTTNWLSVLQFNIGYQLNINKAISLRIEPYAKLPLHGLGIGKLPISSAGVNVGLTLPIH